MKNVLITGGAGFIGSNLALYLLDIGHQVTVLDNLSPQIHGTNPETESPLYLSIRDKVRFIKGSVTSETDWLAALDGVDTIVHLAAETGTGQSMYQIVQYTQINIGGTALMLELLSNRSHSVSKVIIASSRAIYGEGKYYSAELGMVYPKHRGATDLDNGNFEVTCPGAVTPLEIRATDEESRIHPSSVYGITKQNQEQMIMTVCPALGIAAVAFRYQNVYGPGQSLTNPYTGILSIFSGLIRNGKPINIFEDGLESRDFVFISDVVKATSLAVVSEAANNNYFNVGTGVPVTVLEVAHTLCKHYGTEVPLNVTGNYRIGDIRHNYADLTKIKSVLGFIPKVSFDAGIRKFTNWVGEQAVQQSLYEQSIAEMRQKGLLK